MSYGFEVRNSSGHVVFGGGRGGIALSRHEYVTATERLFAGWSATITDVAFGSLVGFRSPSPTMIWSRRYFNKCIFWCEDKNTEVEVFVFSPPYTSIGYVSYTYDTGYGLESDSFSSNYLYIRPSHMHTIGGNTSHDPGMVSRIPNCVICPTAGPDLVGIFTGDNSLESCLAFTFQTDSSGPHLFYRQLLHSKNAIFAKFDYTTEWLNGDVIPQSGHTDVMYIDPTEIDKALGL